MSETLIWIGIVMVLLYLMSFLLPKKRNVIYGSAQFRRNKHLSRWNKGFRIGKKKLSKSMSYRSVLLLGNSGSGKTQKILAINLLELGRKQSVIVTDPKALELHKLTSGYLKQKGAKIYVLNLQHPHLSVGWNPLYGKTIGELQGLMTKLYDTASTKSESEAIWRQGSISILETVAKVLYLYEGGKYLNLANISFFLDNLQVFPEQVYQWAGRHIDDTSVLLAMERIRSTEERIRQGMLAGVVTTIKTFGEDNILSISAQHGLPSIREIREQRSIVYIGIPVANDSATKPFVTLFLSEIFSAILNDEIKSSDHDLAIILEELGNVGKIVDPSLTTAITTMRSKNIQCIMGLQAVEQLPRIDQKGQKCLQAPRYPSHGTHHHHQRRLSIYAQ